jgi:hypothetical protein
MDRYRIIDSLSMIDKYLGIETTINPFGLQLFEVRFESLASNITWIFQIVRGYYRDEFTHWQRFYKVEYLESLMNFERLDFRER